MTERRTPYQTRQSRPDYSGIVRALCMAHDIPAPTPEYHFAAKLGRKWAFDFAYPDARLAIEVDGGVWTGGRHTRGAGWLRDQEKLNTAAAMDWRVMHFTPEQIRDGEWIQYVLKYFMLA